MRFEFQVRGKYKVEVRVKLSVRICKTKAFITYCWVRLRLGVKVSLS